MLTDKNGAKIGKSVGNFLLALLVMVGGTLALFNSVWTTPASAASPAPTISSVSPNSGPIAGGTEVTITGTNFATDQAQFSEVAVGYWHACGIYDGKAYCWGTNYYGELGIGTPPIDPACIEGDPDSLCSSYPLKVDDSQMTGPVTALAASFNQTCAVAGGSLWCWGYYLNNLDITSPEKIAAFDSVGPVTKVSVANGTYCAVAAGKAYCWGSNSYGQLGNGTTTSSSTPVPVDTSLMSGTVTDISTDSRTTCAIADGKAYCWGYNGDGRLGNGTNYNTMMQSTVPVAVDSTSMSGTVTGISAGDAHSSTFGRYLGRVCAIADGRVWCWGDYASSRDLRRNPMGISMSPDQVSALTGTATDISLSERHACAVVDHKAWCWGMDSAGAGIDNLTPSPVDTTNMSGLVDDISVGANSRCATSSTGSFCWGVGYFGGLGDGTSGRSVSSPVAVQMPVTVTIGGVTCDNPTLVDPTTITCTARAHAVGVFDVTVVNGDFQEVSLTKGYTYIDNLAPRKTVDKPYIIPGNDVIYTVQYTNNTGATISSVRIVDTPDLINFSYKFGSAKLDGVAIADPATSGGKLTFTGPASLAVGASISLTYVMTASATASAGTHANSAVVAFDGGTSSAASATTTVNTLTKVADKTNVYPGDTVTYTVTLTNNSTDTWQDGIEVTDQSDTKLWLVENSVKYNDMEVSYTYNDYTHILTVYSLPGLAPGETALITYEQWVDPNAGVGAYRNDAKVDFDVGPSHHTLATASATVNVTMPEPPTITSVAPNRGLAGEETEVTIRGMNFFGVSNVRVGEQSCEFFSVIDTDTITCIIPLHTPGQVDVIVTTQGGEATLANGFTYYDKPTVPQNFTATGASDGINLSWDPPLTDNYSTITSYCYQYREVGASDWLPTTCINTNASDTASKKTTVSAPMIDAGKTYEFRVAAVNEAGQGPYTTNNPRAQMMFITLTADDDVEMTIVPAGGERMSSVRTTTNVKTNNQTGYHLTFSAASSNTNLVHTGDASRTIAPLGFTSVVPGQITGIGQSKWGWRMDGLAGFGAGPTTTEMNKSASSFTWAGIPALASPQTLYTSTTPNASAITDAGTNTDVWFATSATADQAAGTYVTKVLWTAVANE